jgi:hypothetical protein
LWLLLTQFLPLLLVMITWMALLPHCVAGLHVHAALNNCMALLPPRQMHISVYAALLCRLSSAVVPPPNMLRAFVHNAMMTPYDHVAAAAAAAQVENGKGAMPAWSGTLDDDEIAAGERPLVVPTC